MLRLLGIESVNLLTNNPNKIQGLQEFGINVSQRIPLQMQPNPVNKFYLQTKARKSGHLLDFSDSFADIEPQQQEVLSFFSDVVE